VVGRTGGVEAEMQVKQPRIAVSEVTVTVGDRPQIVLPVIRGYRQFDGLQRPIGNLPEKLFPRLEMMQHRHRIDARPGADLAHRKSGFAFARQQRECGL